MEAIFRVFIVFFFHFLPTEQQCFFTDKCYTTADNGMTYRGHINTTEDNLPCINWNNHPFDVNPTKYPFEGLEQNFCRNVHGSGQRPWCYTSTNKNTSYFGYCNVPKCELCLFRGIHFKDGDVFHNGCSQCFCTALGIKCFTCQDYQFQMDHRNTSSYVGCYKKSDQTGKFPNCCTHTVCKGDADFNFEEYMKYLKDQWLHSQ